MTIRPASTIVLIGLQETNTIGYYEPQFSDQSHGFRPKRGCHTALTEIHKMWIGTKWFIEGDIKGCLDHTS